MNTIKFTHGLSIANELSLLIRYNDGEDVIEYKYSNEDYIGKSKIYYDEEEPSIDVNGGTFYLNEFCAINL